MSRSGFEKVQLMKDTLTALLGEPKRRQKSADTEWSAADEEEDEDEEEEEDDDDDDAEEAVLAIDS